MLDILLWNNVDPAPRLRQENTCQNRDIEDTTRRDPSRFKIRTLFDQAITVNGLEEVTAEDVVRDSY